MTATTCAPVQLQSLSIYEAFFRIGRIQNVDFYALHNCLNELSERDYGTTGMLF